MLQNDNIDISDFIRITNAGVEVASFVQIRDALVERYKTVYGSDIDLATSNADGVWVNNLSLIINNILQSVNSMYANLDVDTASGVYLDILCKLSNITRKAATRSTALLTVTNDTSSRIEIPMNEAIFVDRTGTEWSIENVYNETKENDNLVFDVGVSKYIRVICNEIGQVEAPAGFIDKMVIITNLTIVQSEDAIVGIPQESDAALRARRALSTSAAGNTTIENMVGALLSLPGVRDAYVYNNNTQDPKPANDGTIVQPHSIYTILRREPGIYLDADDESGAGTENTEKGSSTIGTIIYNKLTPGIGTQFTKDENVTQYKSFEHKKGTSVYEEKFNETMSWKEAVAISPTIEITLTPSNVFSEANVPDIANSLIEYLNNITLNQQILTIDELLVEAIYADPTFKGRATYTVASSNIKINGANSNYSIGDTYFKYSTFTFAANKLTLT